MSRPVILFDPYPRRSADILDDATRSELWSLGDVVLHDDGPMPDEMVDRILPETVVLLGQTAMDTERLDLAPNLRGIVNVETNFLPNVDYAECFRRGIHVLTPGSAFAPPVAEIALGMAIDLARGITSADRAFRQGREEWGLDGNKSSFSLFGAPVGLVGYGDLGRALHRLLAPFDCRIRVFDPWLPDYFLTRQGLEPCPLDDLLRESRVVMVFAGVSSDNEGFIGSRQFELMQPGSAFLLLSRAAVVDFPAMLAQAASGRLRVATDVFPEEPVEATDPVRRNDGLLLSAHRAGAMVDALHDIGRQAVADTGLMLRDLAPVMCRKAQRETVLRSRSKPVEKT